jgi:hypothetical protein
VGVPQAAKRPKREIKSLKIGDKSPIYLISIKQSKGKGSEKVVDFNLNPA